MLMRFLWHLDYQILLEDCSLREHLMQLLYQAILLLELKTKKEKKFANDVLNSLLLILLFIVTLVEIFTPYFIYIIAPGFAVDQTKFNLAVELTRITFPFLLFVSLSSFFAGILNSNNKFAAAAGAPIILNVILILSLAYSYLKELDYAKQLSYGVTIAGIIQLLFLIYVTKKYYIPSLNFSLRFSNKVRFFSKNYYQVFYLQELHKLIF